MPLITLTSDIGQEDFIIGAVKGQILSTIPGCVIADITHYLSSKNYQQGAYIFITQQSIILQALCIL